MTSRIRTSIGCALLVCSTVQAQMSLTPLERGEFKKATSHEQMMQNLRELTAGSSRLTLDEIGKTVQGRIIPSVQVGSSKGGEKIKVLLFCQQHGNEPSGKEAALMLLRNIAGGKEDALLRNIDLTVIPCVNPDGNEAGKRANANGEDLNRDHLLLGQPEVQAVHALFSKLQPEVTLDVHEYAAYRKEFRDVGYVRSVDAQFGAPTNLNVPAVIREYALKKLFPFLESRLKSNGVTFANYLKMNEPADTVRPSTTSIDDGRQSFAILNRFSFILEGKNGRSMDDELQRRARSQLAAIETFLEFINSHHAEIRTMVRAKTKKIAGLKDPVIVKMDYLYKGERIDLPVLSLKSGRDSMASFASAPIVTPIESVSRPRAYVVPNDQTDLLAFLARHHVVAETVKKPRKQLVERYSVVEVRSKWMENKPIWYVTTQVEKAEIVLNEGDVIVPMNQEHGTMLAIALEPASMWGLVQYDEFAKLRTKGSVYPVYRIAGN